MEERREGMTALGQKVDKILSSIEVQYGSVDISGNKIEGKTTEALRLLNDKVAIQNGRVRKLEDRNKFVEGAGWVIGAVFAVVTVAVEWFKK